MRTNVSGKTHWRNELVNSAGVHALYASRQVKEGPLFWDQERRLWVCTGYEEASTILRDPPVRFGVHRPHSDAYLQERGVERLIPLYALLRAQMAFQDGPQKRHLHAAVHRRCASGELSTAVQALVDAQLTPFVGQSHRGQMDLVDGFAGPLSTNVAALFLGLPLADAPALTRWSAAYQRAVAEFTGPVNLRIPYEQDGDLEMVQEASSYFQQIARARLSAPQDDLISDLLGLFAGNASTDEAREEYLRTVVANSILVLACGYATAANLIVQALLWLAREPAQRRLLEEDPTLLESVIHETLRLSPSSQYVVRQALQDSVIGAKRIRRGQSVIVLLEAANLDERAFPDAQKFLITRRGPRKGLGFGQGPQACAGAPYASLLARIAILTFLQRFPGFQLLGAEKQLEWQGTPSARCYQRVPVTLGALLTEDTTTPTTGNLPAPATPRFPPSRAPEQAGTAFWANGVISVSSCADGEMVIHFDPNSIAVSLDAQHGAISFSRLPRSGGEPLEESRSFPRQTDSLEGEERGLPETMGALSLLFATVLSLSPEQVDEACDFFEAGGDSLALASLLVALEQRLQLSVHPVIVYEHPRLSDLAKALVRQQRREVAAVAQREVVHL